MISLSSRYNLKNISNNKSTNITISGNTYPLSSLNNNDIYSQGYVFAPYVIVNDSSFIIDNEIYKKLLREERIKKLDKLKKLYDE